MLLVDHMFFIVFPPVNHMGHGSRGAQVVFLELVQLDETQRALPVQSAFLDSMGQKMFVCPVWVVITCPGNRKMVKHVMIMRNHVEPNVERCGTQSKSLRKNFEIGLNLFMIIMVFSFAGIDLLFCSSFPTLSALWNCLDPRHS